MPYGTDWAVKTAKPSKLGPAMRRAGFHTDQALADAAGMERSRVTKIKLGISNASVVDALALARALAPHLRPEQLPMKERARRELLALLARASESAA